MDIQVMQKVLRVLSDMESLSHAEKSPEYQGFHQGCQKLLHDLIKKPAFMSILCKYEEEYPDVMEFSTKQPTLDAQDEKEEDKSRSQDVTATGDAKGNVQGEHNMVGSDSAQMTQYVGGKPTGTKNYNAPKDQKIHMNVDKGGAGIFIAESKIESGGGVNMSVENNKSTHTGHTISGGKFSGCKDSFNL